MPETLPQLYARLGSSERGLATDEAERRFADVGPNEPAPPSRAGTLGELARFLANPLVVLLLVASGVSAAVGEIVNAIIIAVMVLLSVVLNFFQAWRSADAAKRLRERVAPTATVLRDGSWLELPRRAVVPGDVVRLSAGDLVPADARLVEARDLHLQESALTGESLPVEKRAGDDARLGASVVSGTATALVYATGAATEFGDIATRLAAHPPPTEFERGLARFGGLIARTVLFLVLFILLVDVALRRDALESLLFALALAVGLTPEFLPMISTVTLARGAVAMAREKVIVKHLAAIQNLGSIDVLCSDKTGTLTEGTMALDRSLDAFGAPSERPLALARVNARFETGIKSPLDAALLAGAPPEGPARKLDEIPFDFERRRLSIVVEEGAARTLITKGAPEELLTVCARVETADGARPLDDALRAKCLATFRALSGDGFRVLAVAARPVERDGGFTADDERDLVLAGFVTFADPPLAGVADSLAALARDGVEVKILTGDNELVARHLCGRVGVDVGEIVLGSDLDRMGDTALGHVAERTRVFARVSPAQKNRVLRALRARSHVVGFLGDGINDAPSLRAADVGISVSSAVDVARDAAEIILLERGLDVVHRGILEGRRAFGNVWKYLLMGTSSNFGNMFSMAGAALLLPFLPMLPTQILLNNFLYDVAQLTIPTDNVDETWLARPHRFDIKVLRNFMLAVGPVSSLYDFLTFFILLRGFHAAAAPFHTGWFVESLATQTLVIFVIRTVERPWKNRPSWPLVATTLGAVAVGIALPFSPLGPLLGLTPLPAGYFLFLVAATATYLALVELVKRRIMRPILAS